MDFLKHLPSPISPTFSEALRIDTTAGSWIFIAGQVGVPLSPDKGSVTFERIRDSLGKLGAGMNHVVSIKTYLTDLGPYAVFSRIRGEFFPKDPPTSTAVQVAGLLLNAKIEIDAVAFLPAGPAA
jgi:2-iminobutanoate/2-iminopropanoate deaminase